MRRFSVMAAGAIFLLISYILYSSLESSINRRNYGFARDQREIHELDLRVKQLQEDIDKNDEIIRQIKGKVNYLFKQGKKELPITSIEELQLVSVQVLASQTAVAKVESHKSNESIDYKFDDGLCKFAQTDPSSVDVQMLDIYKLLKFDNSDGGAWKQGWGIRYDEKELQNSQSKLKVFVVPHSHTDPGWVKTFETYYQDHTKQILNEMVRKLTQEPLMKFIYAEISFFERWWRDINDETRMKVQKLLQNGQFEIVTGAWVMTDEANAHYYAMVDQLIEGNQWLQTHLNYTPENHWSIDPFGLTPTMAYVMKSANFSAMTVQRIHYSVKKYFAQHKHLEFMWRQLWKHDAKSDILCHVFPFYSYDVPHTCGPDPKVCCQFDFRRLPGSGVDCPWHVAPVRINQENVAQRAYTLLDQYRKKAQLYKTSVLLVSLGDDFRYDTKMEWDEQYSNYRQLFDHMNAQKNWNVQAQFGTLSDYFTAVGNTETTFPVLSGDFFTYADRDDHYWSGYYTSRPFYKRMDRVLQHHLRGAEIVFSIAIRSLQSTKVLDALFSKLVNARRNLALFQHHDGVTGTAKDHVMSDYGQKLQQGIEDCRSIIKTCVLLLMASEQKKPDPDNVEFTEHSIKFDSVPEKVVLSVSPDGSNIIVYNSLAFNRTEMICFNTADSMVVLKDASTDQPCPCQINPVIFKDRNRMEISSTIFEVCFVAEIPALGAARYVLMKNTVISSTAEFSKLYTNFDHVSNAFAVKSFNDKTFQVKTQFLTATFDVASGYLQKLHTKGGKEQSTLLSFIKYGTTASKDRSGAYLFMPDGSATALPTSENKVLLIDGPLSSFLHVLAPRVRHNIVMCKFESVTCQSLDVGNLVDITHEENFELGMRIETDIQNTDRSFYTDLNGFQIIRRKYFEKIPLQGNVYPMPTAAFIEDTITRLTFVSGQPNGVASVQTGSLEVFMDRRLVQDDNRGLFQGVTDNKITPNRFKIIFEPLQKDSLNDNAKSGYHTPVSHFSSLTLLHPVFVLHDKHASSSDSAPRLRLLKRSLPCDYHLVTLKTLAQRQEYSVQPKISPNAYPDVKARQNVTALLLHRLAFDCASLLTPLLSCTSNAQQTIDLIDLFTSDRLKIRKAAEMTLNLNGVKANFSKQEDFVVKVEPMEIKAFVLQ